MLVDWLRRAARFRLWWVVDNLPNELSSRWRRRCPVSLDWQALVFQCVSRLRVPAHWLRLVVQGCLQPEVSCPPWPLASAAAVAKWERRTEVCRLTIVCKETRWRTALKTVVLRRLLASLENGSCPLVRLFAAPCSIPWPSQLDDFRYFSCNSKEWKKGFNASAYMH